MVKSSKVQEIVNRFVEELATAAEQEAAEALQEMVNGLLPGVRSEQGATVTGVVKRRKSTKGYSMKRPCPFPGCANDAVARHHMMCKAHGEIPREDQIMMQVAAKQPGGVWENIKAGKKTQAA